MAVGRYLVILAALGATLILVMRNNDQNTDKNLATLHQKIKQETEKEVKKDREKQVQVQVVQVKWPSEKKVAPKKIISSKKNKYLSVTIISYEMPTSSWRYYW